MLTIKINWNNTDFLNYCVYQAEQYVVCGLDNGTTQLLLDGTTNIELFPGVQVYVMNDKGSTVDKIIVPTDRSKPTTAPIYKDSLWINPRTGETVERIGC